MVWGFRPGHRIGAQRNGRVKREIIVVVQIEGREGKAKLRGVRTTGVGADAGAFD